MFNKFFAAAACKKNTVPADNARERGPGGPLALRSFKSNPAAAAAAAAAAAVDAASVTHLCMQCLAGSAAEWGRPPPIERHRNDIA